MDNNIVPQYGWPEKGKRSYAEQAGYKSKRISIVAGYEYGSKSIIAPFEYEGSQTQSFSTCGLLRNYCQI